MVERLAHVLDTAGLGGCDPLAAAAALLRLISEQPCGCPDHHTAHAMMALLFARRDVAQTRRLFAEAPPAQAMSLYARLTWAGATESELMEWIPR